MVAWDEDNNVLLSKCVHRLVWGSAISESCSSKTTWTIAKEGRSKQKKKKKKKKKKRKKEKKKKRNGNKPNNHSEGTSKTKKNLSKVSNPFFLTPKYKKDLEPSLMTLQLRLNNNKNLPDSDNRFIVPFSLSSSGVDSFPPPLCWSLGNENIVNPST